MRVVIGCLAAFGLAVVLLVAGCVGLIGFGVVSAVKDMPSYATHEEISRRHAADLALIREALAARSFAGLAERVSGEVVAIYHADEEVLKRHVISGRSYSVINGGGVGTLTSGATTFACEVVKLDQPPTQPDCLVFFLDRQKGAHDGTQVERP